MNERTKQVAKQFSAADKRLKNAEDAIRRVSKQRLFELMKVPERQRFEHLADANLTSADRNTLRRSLAVTFKHKKIRFPALSGRFGTRRIANWLRRRWFPVVIATVVAAPSVTFTLMAWRNTGDRIKLSKEITLDWKMPSGSIENQSYKSGDTLVIVRESGTRSVARRWIIGQGYATAVYAQ
jgi:exonuclease VII large subunit